ncbi:MAG: LamG-like jellyroll fold domain-containing protein [Actinomycetota bacterium]
MIDGSTQPTFAGSPVVALDGTTTGGVGLTISGGGSTVRSLAVHSFVDGLVLTGAGGNDVVGSWFGLLLDGTTSAAMSDEAIEIEPTSPSNTIGGPTAADRNVVAGSGVLVNDREGILVESNGNLIEGNYVGTDATGLLDRGYADDGVDVRDADDNVVRGNVIGFSGGRGVQILRTNRTVVRDNLIGVASDGLTLAGNAQGGIWALQTNADVIIGGTGPSDRNVVANNGGPGVRVSNSSSVSIVGNEIRANGGIGIDLGAVGVTANDADDGDSGANDLLNFPVLAVPTDGATTIDVDLDVPAGDYRIEVFANPTDGADPSGHGEGETLIHAETVTATGAAGDESFTLTGVPALSNGDALTATATQDLGGGSYGPTSEFSAVRTVTSGTVTVNSTGDGGDSAPGDGICHTGGTNSESDPECSLRAAIEEANASSAVTTIHFSIPMSDSGHSSGAWTITPATTTLPQLTSTVAIDATTQPGWTAEPIIGLDGSSLGSGFGIDVQASDTTVRGLALFSWPNNALITGSDRTVVESSWFGLDIDGTTAGNAISDLVVYGSPDAIRIGGAGVSGNRFAAVGSADGVLVTQNATNTLVEGNVFGLEADGTTATGAPSEGLGLNNSVAATVITGNRFGHTGNAAMYHSTAGAGTIITGNVFGLDESGGAAPVSQALYSDGAGSLRFGGVNPADANTVANAVNDGVIIVNATDAAILGNSITGNGALAIDLADDAVTPNDADDGDAGPNDLLNFPVLTSPSAGETSLQIDLDVPAGDYRIEVFANPTSGGDPTGHGEGETLIHAETVTATGAAGVETFALSGLPVVADGDVLAATATEDLGAGSFGATSEFSATVTVDPAGGVVDRSVRRHDMSAFGGLDVSSPGAGIAGDGFDLAAGGERLSGPAFDPTDTAITMSGWVNLAALAGESAVIAKTGSGGTVHELIVDGSTGEAVARILVGASTIEARGGSVSTGTWHQLAAAWDGADLRLYVDGTQVDSTAAVGTLGDDRSIPVTVGDTSIQSAALVGSVDQVTLGRTERSADRIATEYFNLSDPTGMISVGAPQTEAPGAWATTTSTTRTGSHALDAPNVTSGASPWLVAAGLDEPGLAFESWWYLTDPSAASTAAGTNTQDSPTDQREVRADVAGVALAAIEGSTRTVDATDGTTVGAATWTKVEIRTDETGTSSVLVDGTQVIAPTAHGAGTSSGSAAFRVETLPGGDSWLVDDVRLRRLVSDEPVTSLAPLHRQ